MGDSAAFGGRVSVECVGRCVKTALSSISLAAATVSAVRIASWTECIRKTVKVGERESIDMHADESGRNVFEYMCIACIHE